MREDGTVERARFVVLPDQYAPVRGLVTSAHLKNYAAALQADGYSGYIAMETHTRYNGCGSALPPVAASKANCAVRQRWLAELG